jgi:DNA-binding transcriptional MerR regulator
MATMRDTYSMTQTAKLAKVATATLRNWTAEFADYLSEHANPGRGLERRFTEDDLAVLVTVATMRDQQMPYDDIKTALAAGTRFEPVAMPDTEAPDDETTAAESSRGLAALATIENTIAAQQNRINVLETKVDLLNERLLTSEVERAAAVRELEILRELYEASQQTPAGGRRLSFWEWLRGR